MSDELEKQEPEKPKKKEKKEGKGGLSLPIIIIGSVGGLILIVVTVIFGYFVATKLFPQQPVVVNGTAATEHKSDSHSDANSEDEEDDEDADHEHSAYMETGRITTNPKDAPATFVVLNLSLEFEPKKPDDPEFAEAIDGHGEIKMDAPIMKKLLGKIKSTINNSLASMSLADLNAKRPELTKMYKDTLKPVFKSYNLKLYEVGLIEFIVQ